MSVQLVPPSVVERVACERRKQAQQDDLDAEARAVEGEAERSAGVLAAHHGAVREHVDVGWSYRDGQQEEAASGRGRQQPPDRQAKRPLRLDAEPVEQAAERQPAAAETLCDARPRHVKLCRAGQVPEAPRAHGRVDGAERLRVGKVADAGGEIEEAEQRQSRDEIAMQLGRSGARPGDQRQGTLSRGVKQPRCADRAGAEDRI
mmetsp:Transcript_51474/g.171795  ORF Transcript_51474/g.171795 Transcript_51474/m.171795 type:complete len:204 (+) Transcript_51474:44-655(+)